MTWDYKLTAEENVLFDPAHNSTNVYTPFMHGFMFGIRWDNAAYDPSWFIFAFIYESQSESYLIPAKVCEVSDFPASLEDELNYIGVSYTV